MGSGLGLILKQEVGKATEALRERNPNIFSVLFVLLGECMSLLITHLVKIPPGRYIETRRLGAKCVMRPSAFLTTF